MIFMKRKIILTFILFIITIFLISACGKGSSTKLVNEMSFSLENISDLTISYDDENIRFFKVKMIIL